jgi:type I restriction enzyme M protein
LLDTVVGLPANMFPTTSIPVAILIFDRSREKGGEREKVRDVLFVDATREFIPGKTRNSLSDDHFNKIVSAVQDRHSLPKYAHLASFDELAENDFNLNIPRYVNSSVKEDEVDISAVENEIDRLEAELVEVRARMKQYLRELGV